MMQDAKGDALRRKSVTRPSRSGSVTRPEASAFQIRGRRSGRPAFALGLILIAFCLLVVSCKEKRGGPVSADVQTGYCSVCGMKVKADDRFSSEIIYPGGTKLMFESPGDMLAFYTTPESYDKVPDTHKDRARMEKILVKDYNGGNPLDVRAAALVYKSAVHGPMGPDIFAFSKREEAADFAAKHGGTVVTFDDVTPEMVLNLRKR
ncbi:MAG: nitrous oxide reductase accessory protein NosL [Blastocatellia bacterium]|nr:nitrous oxide reductase accessory protein NosL [Blastocatellia bacterium]